jgi:type II secretory pathway component PulJ
MKLNKKGITIVEIIISVTLVSIVLVFLFNVMITVKNEDSKSQTQSKLLINQALIIKSIQSDIKDYGLKGVDYCSLTDIDTFKPKNNFTDSNNIYCLKLIYDVSNTTNTGYLFYYQYNYTSTSKMNVVGYKRDTNRLIRETDIKPDIGNHQGNVKRICSDPDSNNKINCSIVINMPIIGDDTFDYGINLSYIYTFTGTDAFVYGTGSKAYGFTIS